MRYVEISMEFAYPRYPLVPYVRVLSASLLFRDAYHVDCTVVRSLANFGRLTAPHFLGPKP